MKVNKLNKFVVPTIITSMVTAMVSVSSFAAETATQAVGEAARWQTNMPTGITHLSRDIYDLHMYAFWWCVAIGVVTFGFMFYSIFKYRKSTGHEPATFHENIKIEIIWTIIPFIILGFLVWPAITTLRDAYDTDKADLDILVTGYQWKWKYEYLENNGDNISFFSVLKTPQEEIHNEELKGENYLLEVDEPLVIPVGKKVRFLITAYDVLHAWWVPGLAVKKDAVPGFINETWARAEHEGVLRGQCAELCGKNHGFMPVEVHVVSAQAFQEWKAKKQAAAAEVKELMAQSFSMDDMMAKGKSVYEKNCASCHQVNGEGVPGAFPSLKGGKVVTGSVTGHLKIVTHGVSGTAMAAFGEQLNDVDLAAVVTYERNAWGNNMGDIVQPIDVFNFKKNN